MEYFHFDRSNLFALILWEIHSSNRATELEKQTGCCYLGANGVLSNKTARLTVDVSLAVL